MKLVDIKLTYPDNYSEIISLIMSKVTSIIERCNDETIHIPIEALIFLSKVSLFINSLLQIL